MAAIWEYSHETETKRLIYCLKNIANGFYHINGFYPVALNGDLSYDSTVPLPDLPYLTIPNLIKRLNAIDITYEPVSREKDLFDEVSRLLSKSRLKKPDFLNLQKSWFKAEEDIISEIYRILPEKNGWLEKVLIHPTAFGTTSSFSRLKKIGDKLTIFIRTDQNIFSLTESIITALIRDDVYSNLAGLWKESELITDFLVTQTSLTKILAKFENPKSFQTTTTIIRNTQSNKIKRQSSEFLKKLHIEANIQNLSMKNNEIFYHNRKIHNLTATELEILKQLIEKKGGILSVTELADLVFGKDGDLSLYALSKRIERLRKKLETNGISGSFIQTVRGEGYSLR